MKIRKKEQSVGILGKILNLKNNSKTDTYSANYLNDRLVKVSPTEPETGEKIWVQRGKNLFDIRTLKKDFGAGLTFTPDVKTNAVHITGTPTGPYLYNLLKFKPEHNFNVSLNGLQQVVGNIKVGMSLYKNDGTIVKDFETQFSLDISLYDFDYVVIWFKRQNNTAIDVVIQVLITYEDDLSYEPYIDDNVYININNKYESFIKNRTHIGFDEPSNGEEIWLKKSNNLIENLVLKQGYLYDSGGSISGSGEATTATRCHIDDMIILQPNTTYTISVPDDILGSIWLYSGKNDFTTGVTKFSAYKKNNCVFTTGTTALYMSAWFEATVDTVKAVMLQKGEGVRPYEPYVIPEIFIKNDNGLYEKFDTNIIESGSNERGRYVKYANGDLVCHGTIDLGTINYTTSYGSIYTNTSSSNTLYFPKKYKDGEIPEVVVSAALGGGVGGATLRSIDNTCFKYFTYSVTNSSLPTTVCYIARGKWK